MGYIANNKGRDTCIENSPFLWVDYDLIRSSQCKSWLRLEDWRIAIPNGRKVFSLLCDDDLSRNLVDSSEATGMRLHIPVSDKAPCCCPCKTGKTRLATGASRRFHGVVVSTMAQGQET